MPLLLTPENFAPKPQKSEVADPPVFRGKKDGKETDPKFEDWILATKRKLEENADRYSTDELRIADVAGRIRGEAADHSWQREPHVRRDY